MSEKVILRKAVRYAVMPGVIPGIVALFGSGFSHVSLIMAHLFYMTRLLPAGHPYLDSENRGRYGLLRVIAEAARNIVISKRNIDQMVVFSSIIIALILMFCLIATVVFSGLLAVAHAAPTTWSNSFFVTSNPDRDVAFMMLDKVFAIPGFFGSSLAPASDADIPAYQLAMQELFRFYSMGIMFICILLLIYYAIVMVLESIKDGVPFGNRFGSFYAPARLVIAITLLIPLGYGYNTGQYIVLHAAKLGSGLATNGWLGFNQNLGTPLGTAPGTLLNDNNPIVAPPSKQSVSYITEFSHIMWTCRMYYESLYNPEQYTDNIARPYDVDRDSMYIRAYYYNPEATGTKYMAVVGSGNILVPFNDVLTFFGSRDILIRYGRITPEDDVTNECGEMQIQTKNRQHALSFIQFYWAMIAQYTELWISYPSYGARVVELSRGKEGAPCEVEPANVTQWTAATDRCWTNPSQRIPSMPPAEYIPAIIDFNQLVWDSSADTLYSVGSIDIDMDADVLSLGWAGAGVWYNKIAEINTELMSASTFLPIPNKYPEIMETVKKKRMQSADSLSGETMYDPIQGTGNKILLPEKDLPYAKIMNQVYMEFHTDDKLNPMGMTQSPSVFEKVASIVFGTGGLSAIKNDQTVHPLAQMSAMGSSMINQSIRHMAGAMTASAFGGYLSVVSTKGDSGYGKAMEAVSGVFVTLFSISVVAGFIMAYVVPFMPFMYMFLAAGKWVKSIFEAMVGVPLWALAHMRIDGNGLPGPMAGDGYMLIFEIFLRPILCVFGLIASMTIFSAIMGFLHTYFWLVTDNAGGMPESGAGVNFASMRKGFDEFFYMVMYVILAYILAIANFKLIDLIPNEILRWMGGNVRAFADGGEDTTDRMTFALTYGVQNIGEDIAQAGTKIAAYGGRMAGKAEMSMAERLKGSE